MGNYGVDFDELGVSEVVELLDRANMEAVIRDFGDRNPEEDPVIHFYELFLKEYDAKRRMQRGVFYTPRPVVACIVSSVDKYLRHEFGLVDGLAATDTWSEVSARLHINVPDDTSPSEAFVQILDPATGTGTFLVEVIDCIFLTMTKRWRNAGHDDRECVELWNRYVSSSLLPRLHGFEILMAPYAIAHVKVGLKLAETGYRFDDDVPVRIFLTNSLDPPQDFSGDLEFSIPALAHEAETVKAIKSATRFTVILGNPPYSKMSGNRSAAAIELVGPFRAVDGTPIVERGALALELNLQDDYVKFWGLLYSLIEKSGAGAGCYITNSRYLASTSLRGMRHAMLQLANAADFVDLGGQVSERVRAGEADENVFDIAQGVAIGALRSFASQEGMVPTVGFGELRGSRAGKYLALAAADVSLHATDQVSVSAPNFRFTRAASSADEEFAAWPSLAEVMPFNSGGVITSRDGLAIDVDPERLVTKVLRFAHSPRNDTNVQADLGFSVKAKWNVEACKSAIRALEDPMSPIRPILYRPFDIRWIYYFPSLLDTPSIPVCESLYGHDNLALLTPRIKTTARFAHVFVSRSPAEKKSCSHDRATQMFPMRRFGHGLFEGGEFNLSRAASAAFNETIGRGDQVGQSAFNYVYAILHSLSYRGRYGPALMESYPRVPISHVTDLVLTLSGLGARLIDLHLLATETTHVDRFPTVGSGTWLVGKASRGEDTIWMDTAHAHGVLGASEDVWRFSVGGYQVCDKWLKDRTGLKLTPEDLVHYRAMLAAISDSLEIMKEIDLAIDAAGGWPGAFLG